MTTISLNIFNSMNYVEIASLVTREVERLGTQTKVATRCGVSPATINLIVKENWNGVKDGMWRKVAAALDWRPDGWNVVETSNTKLLHQVFDDAKAMSMWVAVSSPAGSSKTTSAKTYANKKAMKNTFYLECERWHSSMFIRKLANIVGIEETWKHRPDNLLDEIIKFFQKKADQNPILILDQVDKLHEAAFGLMIPLYNGLEDKMGCVIMGVGHLKKRIQYNVAKQNMGWDEIESRFGRTYITTYGATKKDVSKIAIANGLDDGEAIDKVWRACDPVTAVIQSKNIKVVKDMRRLKRCIQRELLAAGDQNKFVERKKKEPEAAAA